MMVPCLLTQRSRDPCPEGVGIVMSGGGVEPLDGEVSAVNPVLSSCWSTFGGRRQGDLHFFRELPPSLFDGTHRVPRIRKAR